MSILKIVNKAFVKNIRRTGEIFSPFLFASKFHDMERNICIWSLRTLEWIDSVCNRLCNEIFLLNIEIIEILMKYFHSM